MKIQETRKKEKEEEIGKQLKEKGERGEKQIERRNRIEMGRKTKEGRRWIKVRKAVFTRRELGVGCT
jgi:hypothetical protein